MAAAGIRTIGPIISDPMVNHSSIVHMRYTFFIISQLYDQLGFLFHCNKIQQ